MEQAYIHAVNTAYAQVASGASDYISAVKRQVKTLADSGLEVVDYESKHRDKVDVAVRRAVISGLKDTTNRISEMNAREMGCDGYEISAHVVARPSHAV
ncbi:hypothetical protein AGMMS49975_16530 [Clostridia bacterium]|nr:hypothetical protein AGMMS49975_16530 [Clostridia bacterium]